MNPILWQATADSVHKSAMYRFMRENGFDDYAELHRWSIEDVGEFWQRAAAFTGVRFSTPPKEVFEQPDDMMSAKWFRGAELNFAENLMQRNDESPALVFRGEDGYRRELTFAQLHSEVAAFRTGLSATGVGSGDRVAAYLPNCPEAVIGMLAAASIGAIWSSCSPDFGINGVVDRFGQIKPAVLVCADGYYRYNGKRHDLNCGDKSAC